MSAFESFVTVHQYQLASIPQELWQPLFMKLGEDYLDAGTSMELHYGDPLEGYSLHLKSDKSLEKHSDIFLIDHAWTTTPETAKKELKENLNLLERLENLMDIEKEEFEEDQSDTEIEHVDEIIKMVAEQANVSYDQAKVALAEENYEIVNAIANLTIDPEFKKKAEELQEQVMGQLIASGKAQEKEEKVNKEKEDRRNQWMERRIQKVYDTMWSYIQIYSYTILKTDGQSAAQTALYINDEVGSALCHDSENPNVKCFPFIFSRGSTGMIPYNVLFPIQNIQPGELIKCDLLPQKLKLDTANEIDTLAYLAALTPRIVSTDEQLNASDHQLLMDTYHQYIIQLDESSLLKSSSSSSTTINKENYHTFLPHNTNNKLVHVYTDIATLKSQMTLTNIKWVQKPEEADIIWTSQDESAPFSTHQLVNHWQNESCLIDKYHLNKLIQSSYGTTSWYPTTYSLDEAFSACIGDHLQQAQEHQPYWITKPDLRIITQLEELVRQYDTPTITPQLAQHYISQPCLYNGKKFDLRFVVVLRSLQPELIISLYQPFWVRLANHKYNLSHIDDKESHLNQTDFHPLTQLDYKSFINRLEKEHHIQWDTIQSKINQSIKDVFYAASTQSQPLGLVSSTYQHDSFGIYHVDFILNDQYHPIIMEIDTVTNCDFIHKDDNSFVNNIFSIIDNRFENTSNGLESFSIL
ncbi:tubulin-tyrosine ligase family-domain-containing protein, partial [Cunninghamella echinulata]